jgi:hypothetical protein
MVRHIRRLHNGLGDPVKEKPSATDSSIQNIFADSDIPSSLSERGRRNALLAKDNDFVDIFYDKFSKIKEIMAFSGQRGSTIFPLPGPFPVPTIDPPVGFHTYVCTDCLTAPIDPVTSSDFMIKGPLAFKSNHVCQQEYLEIKKRRAENGIMIDVIKSWNELRSSSIKFIAKLVHQWYGPENDVSIHVAEVDDSISQSWKVSSGQCSDYDLPLPRETNLGAVADDHWIYRALGGDKHKGTTTIDERELKDFLELEGSTFAIFRVKVRNEEKDLYAYLAPELITEIWEGPSS